MDISKSLEEIGKFFNEILGYLLPGLSIIFLTFYFLDPNQVNKENIISDSNVWMFLFLGYVTGYIVYGLSLIEYKILGKFKFFSKDDEIIKENLEKKEDFKKSKEIILKLIPGLDEGNLNFNDFRNYAMAYVPEVDQKIYTFMFRADLFKHIKTIFLIISFWGLIAYLSHLIFNNTLLFNTNNTNIILIFLLLSDVTQN